VFDSQRVEGDYSLNGRFPAHPEGRFQAARAAIPGIYWHRMPPEYTAAASWVFSEIDTWSRLNRAVSLSIFRFSSEVNSLKDLLISPVDC
jgi:hypothetical protein